MKEGWKYMKFSDCIDKVPKQQQVKSKYYKSFGKYPIVSQEKELISGYWDDESIIFKHIKPVIIFGDHTKEIKFIDFDFVVGADGTQILCTKENIDAKFFYYALKATPIRNLGYARHFKLLKEKQFPVPPLPEQQRIVSYLDTQFAKIDALKANAENQLQAAKDLFQAALKELMTPKEGWVEKKLGEMCGKIQNIKWTEMSGTHKYVDLSSVSREELTIINSIEIDYQNAPSRAKQIMKLNDVLFATTRPTLRRLCLVPEDYDNDICSTGFCVLRPISIIHHKFLFYSLQTNDFYKPVG